jgi:hypothetical protein
MNTGFVCKHSSVTCAPAGRSAAATWAALLHAVLAGRDEGVPQPMALAIFFAQTIGLPRGADRITAAGEEIVSPLCCTVRVHDR